jgi:hypothetical protein
VVRIRRGENYQVTTCRLEGIVVSSKQELKRKIIGCKRYKVGEGILEGYMW